MKWGYIYSEVLENQTGVLFYFPGVLYIILFFLSSHKEDLCNTKKQFSGILLTSPNHGKLQYVIAVTYNSY